MRIYEEVSQLLVSKPEDVGLKYCNDSTALIEKSNDMDDSWENIEDYNLDLERRILIVFADLIADMLNIKK